ncbi:MAG TPA: tetratricopeptide repeat protein [Chitinispirillaceae bacterium]|nr:tetratricopeptide repeat protein [Chitinispirillaceae bacterium]
MNLKYNKSKQEMREDPFIESLLKTKEFFVKNSNQVLGGLIVIAVLIGGFMIFSNIKKSGELKAREAFGKAMIYYTENNLEKAVEEFKITAENHGSSPHASMSAFILARILYDQKKYDEALVWYENSLKGSKSVEFVGGQALEGMAACYEAKGDVSSAIQALEKALKDERVKFRHSAIKWKIALLDRNSQKSHTYLKEIISDTTATDLHQRAENLLATLNAGS